MKIYCQNCGNEAHEGPLFRNEKDYDGRKYIIEVFRHCKQGKKGQKGKEGEKRQVGNCTLGRHNGHFVYFEQMEIPF